jgi:hypothetical protein
MPTVHVVVKEDIDLPNKKRTLTLSVNPEPLDLALEGDEVDVDWVLDNSAAPNWTFASNGVSIKSHGVHFGDNGGTANGKHHGWKRKNRNHKKFVYTINLEDIADDAKVSWDPRIINN